MDMDAKGRQTLFMALTGLLCLAVLAAGVVLSVGYYRRGMNLRPVDMQKYAKVEMEDEVYTLSVDADAIVRDFHLPNPKNTTLDLNRYPDVEAIYSLLFVVTPRQEGGWTIQTGSERASAGADLKKGGLKLVNTEWVWNEQDMKNAYRAGLEYPRKLSMQKYVLCGKNSMGGYVLTVDHERMLRAAGWDLPDDEAARKAHTGYKAVLSLGYYVQPLEQGFLVQTSSTLENVYSLLLDNGVRLTDTTWTYTLEEVEALYAEQHSSSAEDTDAPRKISMKEYVLVDRNETGDYVLTVDYERLLRDTGWELPEEEAARQAHTGWQAVMSLGYYVSAMDQGLLIQTSSSMDNVYAMLLENGVQFTDVSWVLSYDEAQRLYEAQHPAA